MSGNHGSFGIKRIIGRTDRAFCCGVRPLLTAQDAQDAQLAPADVDGVLSSVAHLERAKGARYAACPASRPLRSSVSMPGMNPFSPAVQRVVSPYAS